MIKCTNLLQNMENYQGDLTDIVRASGGAMSGSIGGNIPSEISAAITNWQFQSNQIEYPSGIEEPLDEFGDPFSSLRDPLLHDIDMQGSSFFSSSNSSTDIIRSSVENSILAPKIVDEEIRRPPSNNLFSRMLQISPNDKLSVSPGDSQVVDTSPRGLKPPTLVANEMINGSQGSLVENAGAQISFPRNTGLKRRKSQAKKVVCIPAPAPANSRPSGEVVPSDLWAWRKYGQKPIKGSPYPRGYYRCSSSKGCSARKQVERSRTDPNMLVITYTSEHNHPWPTQRNALAGSTRTPPPKSGSASKASTGSQVQKTTTDLKEEQKESHSETVSSSMVIGISINPTSVKEEMKDHLDRQMEMAMDNAEFDETFPQSYKPAMPDNSNHSEDFFADLGELEGDPLNLLFAQGYPGDEGRQNKAALDAFSFYDWTGNTSNTATTNINNNNNTSLQEAKKGS